MLTTARSGAKTARNAERRAANGGGFRCLRKWSRCEGSEMRGGGRAARARTLFQMSKTRGRKESWGSGSGVRRFCRIGREGGGGLDGGEG